MSVHMRSQDAIYGLGNDIPAFSFVQEMLFTYLKDVYPGLVLGKYYHAVDSLHVYEKHFGLLDKIVNDDEYEIIYCPKMRSSAEMEFIRAGKFDDIPNEFLFAKWLLNRV